MPDLDRAALRYQIKHMLSCAEPGWCLPCRAQAREVVAAIPALLYALDRAEAERDKAQLELANRLDHQYTTSCGHTWSIRHTACPTCFVELRAEHLTMSLERDHALERMSLHTANALQAEAELEQAVKFGFARGRDHAWKPGAGAECAVAAWRERRATERTKP